MTSLIMAVAESAGKRRTLQGARQTKDPFDQGQDGTEDMYEYGSSCTASLPSVLRCVDADGWLVLLGRGRGGSSEHVVCWPGARECSDNSRPQTSRNTCPFFLFFFLSSSRRADEKATDSVLVGCTASSSALCCLAVGSWLDGVYDKLLGTY